MEKNYKIISILVLLLLVSIFLSSYFVLKGKNSNQSNVLITQQEPNPLVDREAPGNKSVSQEIFVTTKGVEKNLYVTIDEEFQAVKNIKDFLKFDETYNSIYYFLILSKNLDREKWYKYIKFLLEREGIKFEGVIVHDINALFDKLVNRGDIIPSSEEKDGDLQYFLNTLPINEGLAMCDVLSKNNEYYNDIVSCQEKIYLYRATKENKYCEKISDPYKVRLCNDFLNYQNK